MKTLLTAISLAIGVILLASCATPPKVVQGTVVSYDTTSNMMVINDESQPGSTLELSLVGAEVGANSLPGDTVRIAYHEQNGKRTATRVMKIAGQAEVKPGGAR